MGGMDFDKELRRLIRQAEDERDRLDRTIARLQEILHDGPRPTRDRQRGSGGSRSKKYGTRQMVIDLMSDGRDRRVTDIAAALGKTRYSISPVVRSLHAEGILEQRVSRGPYREAGRLIDNAGQPFGGPQDWAKEEVQTPASAQ